MKLGWNQKTGTEWYMSSWKNFDDPSKGDFTHGLEHGVYPEFITRKGRHKYYRGGSWNGIQASGSPELQPNTKFTYEYIDNGDEVYFIYKLINQSIYVRFIMLQISSTVGFCQILTWVEKTSSWALPYSLPRDRCDTYALCGPYSTCNITNIEVCQCFKGFKPKSQMDWNRFDWSLGCERRIPIKCGKGEGFNSVTGVKLPDTTASSLVNTSLNLEECRVECLKNCSCTAFANSNIRESESGCIMWFTDLVDMRKLSGVGHELYIRMAASALGLDP
ncbi:hypothetical protein ACHQM5_003415 [Ranunculus cassubicifolius]